MRVSRWVNAKLRDGVRVFELSRPPLAAAYMYARTFTFTNAPVRSN